jgi:hypothetical protein
VGVGVTHASFAAKVQSEIPQVVRTIGFFRLAPSAQPQEPEGQEPRHLVEALGGGHRDRAEAVRHGTFETGANAGRTIEVKSWTQATRRLELWAPTGLPLQVGDQLRIYPGCHKRVLEDCRDRFRIPGSLLFDKGNARNFRGEPYVPGSPLTAVQAGRGS